MAFGYPSYMYPPQMYGGYQQNLQPQPMPSASAQNQQDDARIWVASQTAAESYLLAPNGFVRLWDSSAPRFYEKRADASGRPYPMEIYEYKRAQADVRPMPADGIDVEAELKALKSRIDALERSGADAKREPDAADGAV